MTTTTLPSTQVNATAFRANAIDGKDFAEMLAAKVETGKKIYRLKQELANALRQQELLDERFQAMVNSTTLGTEV